MAAAPPVGEEICAHAGSWVRDWEGSSAAIGRNKGHSRGGGALVCGVSLQRVVTRVTPCICCLLLGDPCMDGIYFGAVFGDSLI